MAPSTQKTSGAKAKRTPTTGPGASPSLVPCGGIPDQSQTHQTELGKGAEENIPGGGGIGSIGWFGDIPTNANTNTYNKTRAAIKQMIGGGINRISLHSSDHRIYKYPFISHPPSPFSQPQLVPSFVYVNHREIHPPIIFRFPAATTGKPSYPSLPYAKPTNPPKPT